MSAICAVFEKTKLGFSEGRLFRSEHDRVKTKDNSDRQLLLN